MTSTHLAPGPSNAALAATALRLSRRRCAPATLHGLPHCRDAPISGPPGPWENKMRTADAKKLEATHKTEVYCNILQ